MRVALCDAMRHLILPVCLLLAACGKGGEEQAKTADPAPAPSPTAPAPRTPVMQITPAPGDQPTWLAPRPANSAAVQAPYGNLLNKPVVEDAR